MFWGRLCCFIFQSLRLFVCKQAFNIVAVRPVAAKGILVEKTLDPAAGAYLVGTTLGADGPTHLAVPATSENHGGSGHPGGQQAHGPKPAGALGLVHVRVLFLVRIHYKTCRPTTDSAYDDSGLRAILRKWGKRFAFPIRSGFRVQLGPTLRLA